MTVSTVAALLTGAWSNPIPDPIPEGLGSPCWVHQRQHHAKQHHAAVIPMQSPTLRMELLTRAPRRLSITISDVIFKKINDLADHEGRSTSNLCAYLLEAAVRDIPEPDQP